MEIKKSITGHLKWLVIYQMGTNYILSDADLHSKFFQINMIKIFNLKTLESFTPEEFFKKEEAGIVA